ncbi:phosphotransferase family protein [Tenggerimyces flavus]|uniref:Phosphotransferase family protein n=1 Tax=Tenggerimyces flavus TaxID=1708749 RepID=A0ABV7Y557_9ACTN|nr:aminoglycoside phosphotransferase family protein [Tenggerimyces flavus]MBM7791141.1 aminoglycoside phosphotransferase (APT) family kinase protein [Tenggerimyces flavus]
MRHREPVADGPGWAAVIAESVPGASVRGVSRVGGGVVAETFAVDTSDGGVIVKRYPRRRSTTVQNEWERLSFAQRMDVPVPRPLALDAEGRWFGMPALAMTRLDGSPDVSPSNVDGWLQELASALAAIHATDTAGAGGALLRKSAVETWRPPKPRRPSTLVDHTVAAIQCHLPNVSWQPVLIHGDFHPGNTLWNDGKLTGIADWCESRLGPAAYELAYCRADVALLLDREAADRLTDHYVTAGGATPQDLPVFDLVCGLDALRKSARMLTAYRQQGRTDSPRQFADRASAFLRHTLAELGAPC